MLPFHPCPKLGKKPSKAQKSIKRSKIKPGRGAFKASDNGKRTRRRTDAEVMAWARQKRMEKLASLHPHQLSIGAVLHRYGVRFEYEWIFENGDRPIFADLALLDHKVTIELDDPSHAGQQRYDKERALFMARKYGFGTVRYSYRQVESGYAARDLKERLGLK